MLCPLTSAHALVISQHVAGRTHTLIGTEGVNAPEGTQQRILGALVDVWSQEEVKRINYSILNDAENNGLCKCECSCVIG